MALLPAAAFGSLAVELALRTVSGLAEPLRLAPYVLCPAVVVVIGTLVAPRHQVATAVMVAVVSCLLSLFKHVAGPQLGGNRVVTTNYVHAGLELAGALAGMALMILLQQPQSSATASNPKRLSERSNRNDAVAEPRSEQV